MTLQEAKSIARHLGLTLRKVRSGDYRVSSRNGDESTACYAVDLEDAVNAAERWLVSASVSWIVTDLERDLASPELKVVAEPVALTAEHAKTFASELEAKNGAVSCAVSF